MKKVLTLAVILISSTIISCQTPSNNSNNSITSPNPTSSTSSTPTSAKTDYTKSQVISLLDCHSRNNPNTKTEFDAAVGSLLLSPSWDSNTQRDEFVNKYRFAINDNCR